MPSPADPTIGFHEGGFRPHGRIVFRPEGRVVYFESTGPFNAETVDAVVRAYGPLLRDMAGGGPFGHISIFHGSMLATPEALEAFGRLLAEWRGAGFQPAVNAYVVAPGVEGRNLMLPMYAGAFGPGSLFRAFERLEDAEAWVAESLRALA